jgi:hypothetical protein
MIWEFFFVERQEILDIDDKFALECILWNIAPIDQNAQPYAKSHGFKFNARL